MAGRQLRQLPFRSYQPRAVNTMSTIADNFIDDIDAMHNEFDECTTSSTNARRPRFAATRILTATHRTSLQVRALLDRLGRRIQALANSNAHLRRALADEHRERVRTPAGGGSSTPHLRRRRLSDGDNDGGTRGSEPTCDSL